MIWLSGRLVFECEVDFAINFDSFRFFDFLWSDRNCLNLINGFHLNSTNFIKNLCKISFKAFYAKTHKLHNSFIESSISSWFCCWTFFITFNSFSVALLPFPATNYKTLKKTLQKTTKTHYVPSFFSTHSISIPFNLQIQSTICLNREFEFFNTKICLR